MTTKKSGGASKSKKSGAARKLPPALAANAKALKASARERLRAKGLAAIDRVKEKLTDVAENVLDLGAALSELAEPGVAKATGHADFAAVCRALKIHVTTARRWMALAANLRRQFVRAVGLDRARALMELADATPPDDDTAEDLLEATLTLPSGEKLAVKGASNEALDAAAVAFRQARAATEGRSRGFTTTPAERKAFATIARRVKRAPKRAHAAARLVAQRDGDGAKVVLEARLPEWAALLAALGGE